MRAEEYIALDATALAELVRIGEVSAQEVAEASIERIEALNGVINAVVERAYESARASASQVDPAAPLAGVPFLAKDANIEVNGLHLTGSCRWLGELPAGTEDAPLARRWRRAGLTILGRTNTPEFTAEFVTEPTWRGATRNPWDLERTPGGSSGGAAAAVASGMVPLAHGTDSGGSIRVPAAVCGLVGLKPSRGWVPVGPHHDELSGGLDCEHVLTRTVRDSALMLDLTAGQELTSRYPMCRPRDPFSAGLNDPVSPLRIGVALKSPGGIRPNNEIGGLVEEIAGVLHRAHHSVAPFEFPVSANTGDAAGVIWMTAIAEDIEFYRSQIGRDPAPGELEALSRECLRFGRTWTAVDYVRARRTLTLATRDMAAAFGQIDVLLLPTTADHPVLTGAIDGRSDAFNFDQWNEMSYRFAPFTELFNATGQPAISLPLGQSSNGLPMGVQLVGRLGEDANLLALSAWLERERPWESRAVSLRRRLLAPMAHLNQT